MNIGMLWFDNSAQPLAVKVSQAAAYYAAKFGRQPNTCVVNPADLPGGPALLAGCQVDSHRSILKNHLWIGVQTP